MNGRSFESTHFFSTHKLMMVRSEVRNVATID